MGLAKIGKTFGAGWKRRLTVKKSSRKKQRVLNSLFVSRVELKPGANQLHRDGPVDLWTCGPVDV